MGVNSIEHDVVNTETFKNDSDKSCIVSSSIRHKIIFVCTCLIFLER